jgi:hypothetical protein
MLVNEHGVFYAASCIINRSIQVYEQKLSFSTLKLRFLKSRFDSSKLIFCSSNPCFSALCVINEPNLGLAC